MNKKILLLVISLFLWPFLSNTYAEKKELQFLFSEDQNIKSLKNPEELIQNLKVEDDVKNDKWLNSPPTRIELLTIVLNQYHKERMAQYDFNQFFSERFEKRRREFESGGRLSTNIEFWANYIPKIGSFVVFCSVNNLGKPKKSMKSIVKELISLIYTWGYYDGIVFPYQATFLKCFEIFPGTDKETIAKIMKGNILVAVNLTCNYDNKQYNLRMGGFQPIKGTYHLSGYAFGPDKEVYYLKRIWR